MPKRREPYHHLDDGKWVVVVRRGGRHMCCDCASVHSFDIRDTERGTEMRFRRDKRATAAARRGFKFTREED